MDSFFLNKGQHNQKMWENVFIFLTKKLSLPHSYSSPLHLSQPKIFVPLSTASKSRLSHPQPSQTFVLTSLPIASNRVSPHRYHSFFSVAQTHSPLPISREAPSQTLSLKLSNPPVATITSQTQTPISQSIMWEKQGLKRQTHLRRWLTATMKLTGLSLIWWLGFGILSAVPLFSSFFFDPFSHWFLLYLSSSD